MSDSFDVVALGGGVMGCAIAYFLCANPDFKGRVAIVERDPTYARASTPRSWGGLRQQFSTRENIQMSLYAAEFIKLVPEILAVDGEAPDLAFHENGYLFTASESGLPILQRNIALQRELGADILLLTPDEIAERFPWINTEGLAGAGFGASNEGWLDPNSLLQAFRRKARALGAVYIEDEVAGIERRENKVTSLRLASGTELSCGLAINCAGPQAGAVAALAGIDLPVGPRKRMTYVFDCREALPAMPLTIDPSGVVVRNEGTSFITIVSPPEDQDSDCDDLELDYASFEAVNWPTIAHRIPAFESIKLTSAWAGLYDYNAFDQNAVLGPHPEIANFLFCNGFSGHGIQQSPAAGRYLSELILYGEARSLDLATFAYDRIPAGRRVKEANVW